jgi:bla regulator protein blaR1
MIRLFYTRPARLVRLNAMWNASLCLRRTFFAAALIGVATVSAAAQENAQRLLPARFEVSSVKRVTTARDNSRTNVEHGTLTASNITIRGLIRVAFDIRDYQILNAPAWTDEEHYDVIAKAAAARDFTDKQMEPLIQDLLNDRFGFKYARETRSLSGYSLLVANGGAKLKVADDLASGTGITTYNSGKVTVDIKRTSMARLAVVLESLLKQPVTNQTGLAGAYALQLEYDSGLNPDSPLPSLFTALQSFGLRLQAGKVPVEMILVEDVHRPAEN